MLPSIFQSTTLRLTGWYLFILMSISIMFSSIIYQVATGEIQTRLERFQNNLQISDSIINHPMLSGVSAFRANQVAEAQESISIELLYINICVLIAGGFLSYYLARRSILPIQKAHEAQSRFTSDASHELRTPLAVMKMELEVALRDKNITIDELKEILNSNLEEVNRLSKLSEMLLSLSRLDHDNLKIEPIDISRLSNIVVKEFKQPESRLQISAKHKIMISGNETAIIELIRILIDNALQYSPKDSLVYIEVSKTEDKARFEITNTGKGISAKKLPHIFDRFYRADSSRTNGSQKGYGLGLALAKSIADLHKSELIASSNPGHETIFTFLIDLIQKPQAKTKN